MPLRRCLMFMVVAASLTWASSATAQPGGPGPGGVGGPAQQLLPVLLRGSGLTPEQQRRARDILADRQRRTAPLTDQLRQAHEELIDKVISQAKVQAGDFEPQLQRMLQLRDQLLQENIRVVLEVKGLLTPAQLSRAVQMKDRLRALDAEYRQLWKPTTP